MYVNWPVGPNVLSAKCMSCRLMSCRPNVLLAKYLSAKCPVGSILYNYIRHFADSASGWRFNISYISQYISLICDYFR